MLEFSMEKQVQLKDILDTYAQLQSRNIRQDHMVMHPWLYEEMESISKSYNIKIEKLPNYEDLMDIAWERFIKRRLEEDNGK